MKGTNTMNKQAVKELVYSMLITNTGIHPMDSGGGEGRMWQQNQKKTLEDFENEPTVTAELEEWKDGEFEVTTTISTFHYLTRALELDALCEKYNKLKCNDWDSDIFGVSKSQARWLDRVGFVIGDAENTYNYDSRLSQVLQYTSIKLLGNEYVLLQLHNGADVRGGYTDAKLFKVKDDFHPMFVEPEAEIDGFEFRDGKFLDAEGHEVAHKITKDSKIEAYLYE